MIVPASISDRKDRVRHQEISGSGRGGRRRRHASGSRRPTPRLAIVVLILQVDAALGSPATWDWPGRLGLRPPEGVVVQVERLREKADDTGEPVRSAP